MAAEPEASGDSAGETGVLSNLLRELTDKGLADLMQLPEVRGACLSALEEIGCRPPGNHVVLFALEKLARAGGLLLSDAMLSRVAATLLRNGKSRAFILRIQGLNATAQSENALKEALLNDLAHGNGPERDFKADAAAAWQVVAAAHTRAALDGLDADLADLKDGLYDALIGALEEWDAFTPSWVEAAPENPSAIAALRYSANVFQFLGRDDEEADLDAFLFEPGPGGRLAPFRWVTLTGEGGLGKTRLAYEFVQVMPDGWAGGLLREADLRSLTDKARWRPKQPTLFVIDYPGRFPKPVGQFLGYLQRSAKDFDLPVRVLLLERDGTGPWRDTIYDAGGASLANLVWRAAEHESGWPLGPVHPEKLIASMRARFQGQDLMPPPDDVLMPMLFQVDGGLVQTEDHFKPTRLPRPLFAAAIAEIGIRRMQEAVPGEAIEPAAVFDGVDRDQVLEAIISRDRRLRWQEAAADQAVLDAHENLLALATFCRGFDLASLNGIAKPLADHLPSHTPSAPIPLNRALLDAMTRIDAAGELAPLEPDILGERHLLDRLDELRQASTAEAFLDAGYALAGLQAPYTAILTLRDHTARFAKAGYFFPGVQCTLPAARAFAAAAMDHIGKLGDAGAWDQIESLLAHLDALRQDARFAGDREIALREAMAAVNVANHAGGVGRWDDVSGALARIDALRQDPRFAEDGEILLQEGMAGLAVYANCRTADDAAAGDFVVRGLGMALSLLAAAAQGVAEAKQGAPFVLMAVKDAAVRWPGNAEITALKAKLTEAGVNWDSVPDWPDD